MEDVVFARALTNFLDLNIRDLGDRKERKRFRNSLRLRKCRVVVVVKRYKTLRVLMLLCWIFSPGL